ncbi:cyanophycinase [Alloiococcus sp. CFN-8]|uniref:cyanophycinase n=1 Tax=Alloiococcus sp. CFN-8 TaxID=3416081 RepID=UPI003CEB37B6
MRNNRTLIIIGGAEDKKGNKEILKEVCASINKENDKLLIATLATESPEEVGSIYKEIFSSMGVKNIKFLNITSRPEAFEQENINLINESKLMFFTGGDQLKITSLIGGSPVGDALRENYKAGCVYVGTSAGASVVSNNMIISGDDEESPKKFTLKISPGLGLIENVIIDQHFAQRGRIGRILAGIAQNPFILGIGIDEDTAMIVNNNSSLKVIGSGAIYIIDGREITYTNVSEQHQEEVLSIFNVKMHILKRGNAFDLIRREPIEEEEI